MEWFVNLQFFSGLIIGSSFGLVGGLILGLVVGAPLASEIMAAEGSIRGSSWNDFKVIQRKSKSVDSISSVTEKEPGIVEKTKISAEIIDMSPPGERPRDSVGPVKLKGDVGVGMPPPPGISTGSGSETPHRRA